VQPDLAKSRQRGPRSDAQRNDEQILRTAARVLAEDPRATIQRIADDAGVARITVYRRYRNRDDLRRAIHEAAAVDAQQVHDDAAAAALDPISTLRALIIQMAAINQRYPLLAVSTDWQPLPTDAHRPSVPPAARRMHRTVFALVTRGQRDGSLRADLPAELLPQAITGTLHVVTRFARSLGTDTEHLGERVADLLLDGFAAHPRSSETTANSPTVTPESR
jgi:TetR/AcrR family transcriptional regulator, mexCD-oprJ operon repressor